MLNAALGRTPESQREQLRAAARQLETLVLKQLVTSSGAFSGGEGAGSGIRADLFANTLAETLAKGGGIGLAAQLERSITREPPPAPGAAPHALPRAPSPSGPAGASPALAPSVARVTPTAADPCDGHGDLPELALPVDGRVSSAFGVRADPFTGERRHHGGMDFAAPEGTEIRAAAGGRVVFAGDRGGYGRAVEIDHGNGVTTLYGHAAALHVVEGETVLPGQPIGTVGASGRATGPHLHFEVREGRVRTDPGVALKKYGARADDVAGAGP